jgi:putative ABC transport system permease protein
MNFYQENRIPIAILKSIGYNNNEIHKRYLLGMYLSLCLMYIISIPITMLLLNQMLALLSETIGFQLILDINIVNMLIGFILIHGLFGSTVYFINRYYNRIQISEIMKQNIK